MYLSVYRPAVRAANPALSHVLDSFFGDIVPAAREPLSISARFDVVEKAEGFEAFVDLPGINKEDIEIDVEGARVSVRAQTKTEALAEGERVIHNERRASRFARTFDLPVDVDSERAEAHFENGVLRLVLPKKDVVKAKRLSIQ